MNFIITIDGPAASGKSSVSRDLAQRLKCSWVSTGAFYRGLAYVAQRLGVNLTDSAGLAELVDSPDWKVAVGLDRTSVFYMKEDVTDLLAQESVGNAASQISHYPDVRKALLAQQRKCGEIKPGIVAEGRDCGTVIFPNADAKIYLTASSEHRAARRAQELGMSESELQKQQHQRDHQDSTRKVAPLQIPEQALVIDTTHLNLKEVVDQIEIYVRSKLDATK